MTKTRSTRIGACAALAMATVSIASTSIPSIAAAQEPDRVWEECKLNSGESEINTIQGLLDDMEASSEQLAPSKVAFVVIYSFEENDGQQLTAGGFTGPVICRAPGVNIDKVQQTDDIPTTNVLDVENVIILRYGTTNVEKRYCHTVDGNADCFRMGGGE
jgi:hypothetical protein